MQYPHGMFGVAGDACDTALKTKAQRSRVGLFLVYRVHKVIVEIVIARATNARADLLGFWVFGEG